MRRPVSSQEELDSTPSPGGEAPSPPRQGKAIGLPTDEGRRNK